MSFHDLLLPAPREGGFRMPGYWVWCGSAIRGEDGRYHLFASRWPKDRPFMPHWLTSSEVVRAVAERPEGPYTFQEVVLPERGPRFWDGRMTHCPTIHKCGGTYLLYYVGVTFEGPAVVPGEPQSYDAPRIQRIRATQRIGLATAPSVLGPWKRRDKPILDVRPDKWDALVTTNPAACVHDDGRALLVYKSVSGHGDLLRIGAAWAEHYDGPYERPRDEPVFDFNATGDHLEDPYIWWASDHYEMLVKDMRGGVCGKEGGGIHATSTNGVDWTVSDPPLAYSHTVKWDDGSVTEQLATERPQLLIQEGRPTHLFLATAAGPEQAPMAGHDCYRTLEDTWSMVIPLRTE